MNLNPFARRREQRAIGDDPVLMALMSGSVAASGVRVNNDTALASVAVAACIEVRAETFSALPGGVFRREDRKRVPADEHPVAKLLFDRPNDLMTGGELMRWKQMRQDITGNAQVRIVWRNGRPAELWPMYGTKPEIRTAKGKIAYRYAGDDFTAPGDYPAADILHFKGPFLKNPLEAASPIDLIRDTIGLSISSEQFFGRFLNNGSHFPTYLETDNALTVEDVKAIQASLKATAGIMGAGTARIFDRGLKVKQNSMSLRDADLTAQQRWYLEQVCRMYRVPLPLVQDWTHGTYTNSEQAGLWFAQHTILPIAVDTERVVKRLFVPGEEANYVKWNVDAILRGDYTTRTEGYSTMIQSGVLSRNEARAYEDLDPYEGGDEYLVPLNMSAVGSQPAPAAEPTPAPADAQRDALTPILEDAVARIRLRREQDVERGRAGDVTERWARDTVLPPIAQALRNAGSPDVDGHLNLLLEEAFANAT